MAFFSATQVDDVWEAVCGATRSGNLGWGTKLSLKDRAKPALMAFTVDAEDADERDNVLQALRDLLAAQGLSGTELDLRFKTDADTRAGRFSRNDVSHREAYTDAGGHYTSVSAYTNIASPCKFYNSSRGCMRGDACHYQHNK